MTRESIRAYWQLTKPGIIRGNVVHVLIGLFVAETVTKQYADVYTGIGVVLGTALIIASACVVNNYTDRELDKRMKRTKSRPSVTGQVSVRAATIYASMLGGIGAFILAATTNPIVVASGGVAYMTYVWLYAVAKRQSVHGTLVGAIPGALPAFAGYVAVTGRIDLIAVVLTAIIFVWQLPHFYAISLFRKREYAAAGVPVAAVVWSLRTVHRAIAAGITSYLLLIVLFTFVGGLTIISGVIMTILTLSWLYVAVAKNAGLSNERWARKVFAISLGLTMALLLVTFIQRFYVGIS